MKKINFYAGPSFLDESILEKAIALISKSDDLSILEISHRSKKITDLFLETKHLLKEMMHLEDNKEILFLQGGASLQFAMIPLNIKTKKTAGFLDTGVWTQKAIVESKKVRHTKVIGSGAENGFNKIPDLGILDYEDLGYLHLTSNNTIYGTQFHEFPITNVPLVVDMSSDILSRKLDFNQFDLIFAGFQKNLGTTGGCLVIVNKNIIDSDNANLLSMLDYNVHIKNDSMFNTPPVFSVLMCNLTLKWILEQGGLEVIEARNIEKANLLYSEIERNSMFFSTVDKKDRSLMNVCFEAKTKENETKFLNFSEEKGIVGIKGHKLKGGFRASIYNAMPLKDVAFLVEVMQEFEKQF